MNAMLNFAVTPISPLPHLLQALRALYPPQCVVHVGIGQGMGELVEWRNWTNLPSAVLIDSDDTRMEWARHGHPPTWRGRYHAVSSGRLPYQISMNWLKAMYAQKTMPKAKSSLPRSW